MTTKTTRPIPKWRRRHNQKYDVKWRGVVKVQRSLWPAGESVLIYSRDGSIHWQDVMRSDLDSWFGEPGARDEHKFFAVAELRGTEIRIIRKVNWRYW